MRSVEKKTVNLATNTIITITFFKKVFTSLLRLHAFVVRMDVYIYTVFRTTSPLKIQYSNKKKSTE